MSLARPARISPADLMDDATSYLFQHCESPHFQQIHFLTGCRARPAQFPHNALGFEQYVRVCGARHFGGTQLIAVRHPDQTDKDAITGDPIAGKVLLPARWAWPRLVAPACLLELCRAFTGPIVVRHAWRPPHLNKARGGKPASDHLWACALDVRFASYSDVRAALRRVLLPRHRLQEFGLSLGYHRKATPGSSRDCNLHLGVWAPETARLGRPRAWHYD